MSLLWRESVIDGFEFQNLAEWDDENPPRDEREKRSAAWNESQKHTTDEIATLLQETGLPILSVHANRDVGICLCSEQEQDIHKGKRLIHESLYLAEKVGASVCVFHLWDTWKEGFDPRFLQDIHREIAAQYPGVKASVENVPTHLAGSTPFELVRRFEWITLDLQWAALYDELDRFGLVKDRIANVHLRGRLEGSRWALEDAPFGFYEALETIRVKWGYEGMLTMESAGLREGDWENLVAAMSTLRARY
jgi:L-ribulose-5-phosphate 3-epimerase UlaE